jgi:hypothetical protein
MKHLDFIEIGTSDFDTLIQKTTPFSSGLTIEPIKHYLDQLPTRDNVEKLQLLVSDENGVDVIYYIDPNDVAKYNLPWEVKGMNCIGHPHPGYDIFNIKQIKEYNIEIKKETIQKITLHDLLLNKQVASIGYLKIDTEGHDCIILNKFIDDVEINKTFYMLPNCILFESNQWTDANLLRNTIERFSKYYTIVLQGHDTIMVKIVSSFYGPT